MKKIKIVIVAPYWNYPSYVGSVRVERFVRWLEDEGFDVVIIKSGDKSRTLYERNKTIVVVKERFKIFPEGSEQKNKVKKRTFVLSKTLSFIRSCIKQWIVYPDPLIFWGRSLCRNKEVVNCSFGARIVLSSSPPESVHIAADLLSKKIGAKHIVDMRDGWIDEPLKNILNRHKLRWYLESIQEKRILNCANSILVSSDGWKSGLIKRYPSISSKITVITNTYPLLECVDKRTTEWGGVVNFVYAGKLSGSHSKRNAKKFIEILYTFLKKIECKGCVTFYGFLADSEINHLKDSVQLYSSIGWELCYKKNVPRHELLKILSFSDGLLLYSESQSAIPSKVYEYIKLKKPIIFYAKKNSDVSRLLERIPNAMDVLDPKLTLVPMVFSHAQDIPVEYEECYVKKLFLEVIRNCKDV